MLCLSKKWSANRKSSADLLKLGVTGYFGIIRDSETPSIHLYGRYVMLHISVRSCNNSWGNAAKFFVAQIDHESWGISLLMISQQNNTKQLMQTSWFQAVFGVYMWSTRMVLVSVLSLARHWLWTLNEWGYRHRTIALTATLRTLGCAVILQVIGLPYYCLPLEAINYNFSTYL